MMLHLSDEQSAIAASCRALLARTCTLDVVRDAATPHGDGHSEAVWAAMRSAGWFGIPFPEKYGGLGRSLFELGLAYREVGRFLVPTTLHSTIAMGLLGAELGTPEQKAAMMPRLCAGDIIGAVGISGDTSDRDEACAIAGVEAAGLKADPGGAKG